MKRKKPAAGRRAAKRNPIARAVRKIRPQVTPDLRRRKLADARKREADAARNEDAE